MEGLEPTVIGKTPLIAASDVVHVNLLGWENRVELTNKKAKNSGVIDQFIGYIHDYRKNQHRAVGGFGGRCRYRRVRPGGGAPESQSIRGPLRGRPAPG